MAKNEAARTKKTPPKKVTLPKRTARLSQAEAMLAHARAIEHLADALLKVSEALTSKTVAVLAQPPSANGLMAARGPAGAGFSILNTLRSCMNKPALQLDAKLSTLATGGAGAVASFIMGSVNQCSHFQNQGVQLELNDVADLSTVRQLVDRIAAIMAGVA